jgi:hypothetical protein
VIKYYSPVFDFAVLLLALASTVHYAIDHTQYNSSVIYLLTAIFLKLGVIANKE